MIIKRCPCCHREYTREAFDALPYVGRTDNDEIGDQALELRLCSGCKSTLAMVKS
jgi:hypothetical protein